MERVLVIEDEEPIRELIKLNLQLAGCDIIEAEDGEEGLRLIKEASSDLIVLDIMLPKIDGYKLLPYIIERDIPVIMLTAKSSLKDKVMGLNLGADDYMTKPFEAMELIARVKALLRRAAKEEKRKGFDDIEICVEQRKVFKGGVELEFTPKEFELLNILVDNKGIALSREKLLELVWDFEYEGNTRTVDMHIQRLRTKLKTDKIATVYKLGYRLEK
ncbi:response regulator transcription factor [Clostridium swellfunianum]|uniref:response regulator transcription factor n=1 Tax=Clostridium swellfunianum TaxID=1367462 RepID=UPI00202F5D34|nr:response regulator transcription factor [Clostridium swellfunianum]